MPLNWMGFLQQLGRSLMLPTMALPAAAILLATGVGCEAIGAAEIGDVLTYTARSIFAYLPYLFAVGVALGMSDNDLTAGMTALMSYFLFTRLLSYLTETPPQIGVSGAIVIGLITSWSYHRFKEIKFPEYIQFFGGSRFVPLFMSFTSILLAYGLSFLYPYLDEFFSDASQWILGTGGFGAFVYGTLHRFLVPSGLHHMLNNVAWFQVGGFTRDDGVTVFGDLPRFFAGDPTAGIYMTGLYPVVMFALPTVAFAIIHEARDDLKPKIRLTFLTAAVSSFLTGVTEPIEFAFLFVAPYLFLIHAVLSGAAMWITYELDIFHGFSFSAGAIDFLVNAHLARNEWLLIPIGLAYALVYYFLFRWAIRRFQIPTPGREDGLALDDWIGDIPYRAPLVLQALGGKNNIVKIESCITRLRLTVADDRKVDITALRHLGAAGVIRLGHGNLQAVFGTFSELLKEQIVRIMKKDTRMVHFQSPVQGFMIPLADVPDKVFASKLVGDGVAFMPERGEVVAPVSGTIIHVYPSMHAIGIRTAEGLDVLIHVGIDTAQLNGKGFACEVKPGDRVEAGQLLIRFQLAKVKQQSKSLATPMVITNPDIVKSWSFAPFKAVKKGQTSVMSVELKEELAAGGSDA